MLREELNNRIVGRDWSDRIKEELSDNGIGYEVCGEGSKFKIKCTAYNLDNDPIEVATLIVIDGKIKSVE